MKNTIQNEDKKLRKDNYDRRKNGTKRYLFVN